MPGVSSLTACAAVLGAPLVARNDVLTVVPATLEAESDLRSGSRTAGDAAAIVKVGRNLEKVRAVLNQPSAWPVRRPATSSAPPWRARRSCRWMKPSAPTLRPISR